MAILMDGKKVAAEIEQRLRDEIFELGGFVETRPPKLVVVTVGENEASEVYVRQKEKAAARVGILFEHCRIDDDEFGSNTKLLLDRYAKDSTVDGIILQLPTPFSPLVQGLLQWRIPPEKDVDGLTVCSHFDPCTPKGIIRLLDEYKIPIEGENVTIIGRSDIVGRPLARMMLDRDATVTVCHSKTPKRDLQRKMWGADILISAVGKPGIWGKNDLFGNNAIIDVGISRVDGKLVGDFDADAADLHAEYRTPVPGGVGAMTVAMLMENTVEAWRRAGVSVRG